MNRVNLNTASDTVRQVILSFSPNGTIFELDGRSVACLIPPPTPTDETQEWTNAKTRRFYLIDKEIDGSITEQEVKELADLTKQMRKYVNAVAPLPIDAAWKLREELLAKALNKSCRLTGR